MKKKILILVPSIKDVSPIKAAMALAIGLSKKFSIIFMSYDSVKNSNEYLIHDLEMSKVKVDSLNCHGFKEMLKAKNRLEHVIEDDNIDICLSFLIRGDVLLSLVNSNVIKVSSVRNMLELEYVKSHGWLFGNLFGKFHLWSLKRLDKIVVMSSDMNSFFLKKGVGRHKLNLIHNFLDENRVVALAHEKASLPCCNNIPVVISISSLLPRKRVDLLIKYALELYSEGVFFNLVILGEGVETKKLKILASSDPCGEKFIHFLGHVTNSISYLNQSDAFVMASESEGVSRSLMEALFLNKPCIVSDIPGNRELAEKAKSAFLFNSQSSFNKILKKIFISNEKSELPAEYSLSSGLNGYHNLFLELIKDRSK